MLLRRWDELRGFYEDAPSEHLYVSGTMISVYVTVFDSSKYPFKYNVIISISHMSKLRFIEVG